VRYLAESKKVVIVGIAGVGKTTIVTKAVELLREKKKSVSVHSFGSVMLDEAKKSGINDRDQLRKLDVSMQQDLQRKAAEIIAIGL